MISFATHNSAMHTDGGCAAAGDRPNRYADDGARRMNLKHIAELLNGEGSVTLGAIGPVGCAAVASDGNNCLAMLVRYAGESLEDLLTRLDEAIRAAVEDEVFTDEING